ncbi:asparagine synthase-related protein [Tistrella mobilis]|uniref:asparagine synthase (glutamine-hydrolyzing) n=1 Tax=Tistrella mobilis (strain KA081020-065) TaxID=1110502 RepID=I3TR39_TISMK|nr:asparagine synthase-related protein [Tistrella mobilis]AFK55227.1 Asparagine synthase (glutamine-hydrolyzing) [Tistrella mobilis KA081020-065]
MRDFAGLLAGPDSILPADWLRTLDQRVGTGTVCHRLMVDGGPRAVFASWPVYTRPAGPRPDDGSGVPDTPSPAAPLILFNGRLAGNMPGGAQRRHGADLVRSAWRAGGAEALAGLTGDYVAAIWDGRHLALLRDVVGVLPLYLVARGGLIAFSTDFRLLTALPRIPARLDRTVITDQLVRQDRRAPSATCHAAVRTILPGECLVIDTGKPHPDTAPPDLRHLRRWTPVRPADMTSPDPWAGELRQRLIVAIHDRIDDAERPAVLLSGGLDSSAIALIAAKRLRRRGKRLLAISAVLPLDHQGPERDEWPYVLRVAEAADNIDLLRIEMVPDDDPFAELDRVLDLLGRLPFVPLSHGVLALGAAAAAQGVDVLLNGFAGDLFVSHSGRQTAAALLRQGRLREAVQDLADLHRVQGVPWSTLLRREVVAPLLPAGLRPISTETLPLRRDALSAGDWRRLRRRGRRFLQMGPQDLMRVALVPGRVDHPASDVVGISARLHGVDLRLPMLDQRLLSLMMSVPAAELRRGGWERSLYRRAMAGILPDEIRWRRDKGPAFDPVLAARLARYAGALEAWAETAHPACWAWIDRDRYLAAVRAVRPSGREGWTPAMFDTVMTGTLVCRFLDREARSGRGDV